MNRFAYLTTGLAIKTISSLSRANIKIYGEDNIPKGSIIFVINHFTRIETLFLPYYFSQLTNIPIWSLADYSLFKGSLGGFLDSVGAVSTKNPDRDRLIVKSLLTGEAHWIIFPEGRMVKNKKILEKGRYMIDAAGGKHPPHTGAATLALRTEFYRNRLRHLIMENHEEANRLMELFQLQSTEPVFDKTTFIVPVNTTYYPLRAKENILSHLAAKFVENMPSRMVEEIMTEGTMLLSGVDMDVRFGKPIPVREYLKKSEIERDMASKSRIDFDDPIPSKNKMRKTARRIMERYMAAIYSMTTVNHDHLFASVLKYIPCCRIDPYELRRKVFWAIQRLNPNKSYIHSNLLQDQVHLITDDHFGKFKEFLSIAVEKQIIDEDRGLLCKDMTRFSSIFDFHQIRIDNPVSVMANEIEPLKDVQRIVRRISRTPSFFIKRKIVKHLIEKDLNEFEDDYRQWYSKNETKSKDVGQPFLVRGKSKHTGIVLIHGYMAAPMEVKSLATFLGEQGYWVYAPRLKGHGTSPEDLAIRTYLDWADSVSRGYAIIRNICKNVIVGGFSTGAALAFHLADRVDHIRAVFAVSTPLMLKNLSSRFVPAVDAWNRIMNRVHLEAARKMFVENQPENPHINYHRNPIAGVREIELLMNVVEPRLAEIQAPCLVIQSQRDPVVNSKSALRIFEKIGAENKRLILFNYNRHGILLGKGSSRVHHAVADFIKYLPPPSTPD